MAEHDPRKRSGVIPNLEIHEQMVAAMMQALESYQQRRETVDVKTLERLREDMNEGFRKVDTGFERVNVRLDAMDTRFSQGTSRFAVQETKMARAEEDIKELKRVSTTERLLAVQAPEKESDEGPVVSNKFKNAIWLGIAGSIGAGIVLIAGMALKPAEPPADQKYQPPPATPVTPASPRAAIPSPGTAAP